MAAAHAMLVNLGVYNEPHTIRRIQTDDGNVYEPQTKIFVHFPLVVHIL